MNSRNQQGQSNIIIVDKNETRFPISPASVHFYCCRTHIYEIKFDLVMDGICKPSVQKIRFFECEVTLLDLLEYLQFTQ